MRPNFFVNTPDILHAYAAVRRPAGVRDPRGRWPPRCPRPGACTRGFELFEHVAVRAGSEEYLDCEKYQLQAARLGRARSREGERWRPTSPVSTECAATHPALQQLRNLHFHSPPDNEAVIAFSKRTRAGRHGVSWSVVNLDPRHDPRGDGAPGHAALGLDWHGRFAGARRAHRGEPTAGVSSTTCASSPRGSHTRARSCGSRRMTRAAEVTPARHDRQRTPCSTTFPFLTAPGPAQPRPPRPAAGSNAPCSTRSSSGPSTTATATASATSAACTDKLDYLQWLGVDCLWLPPFFASPLRDGGYDVSRLLRTSCPSSATSQDFRRASWTRPTSAACGSSSTWS